jgi:anti-sigma B factor antagonist
MELQVKDHQGMTLAEISGELDGRTAPELLEALPLLLQNGKVLLLDMSQTTYMSSAGLRVLLLLHREADARGVWLLLVGVRRELKSVMSATGFLRFFHLAETLEEATRLLAR